MRRRLQDACACAVLIGAAHVATFADGPAAGGQASAVVAWARGAGASIEDDEIPIDVLDMTPADVGALARVLETGSEDQRAAAAFALFYAGSDAAIDALRASPAAGPLLYMALASRGLPADRSELLRVLDRGAPAQGDDAVAGAAMGLGLLRAPEAIPALERLAADPESDAGDAARDALRAIRLPLPNVDALPRASDEDRVIAAALRAGVLAGDDPALFDDQRRGGVWVRDRNAWRFRRGARVADGPSLDFSVRFNAGKTRAILSVSRETGPKDAAGYDCVLTRDGDAWKVRFFIGTWVA